MAKTKTERYTMAQVEAALRASAGIYTAAAAKLKCAPNTVKNYVTKYPALKDVLKEITEGSLDLAEGQLLSAIKGGNLTAVIFFLPE